MVSGTGVRDFNDFLNQPWQGKIFPELFNDVEDAGDGHPGLQACLHTWTKDYLHSGGIETGLLMEGEDITGVANLYTTNAIINGDITGNTNLHIGGDSELYGDISGDLDHISGYESVSANTGIFQDLKGFSDIGMQDSLDFKGTYHIKDASQITGSLVHVVNGAGLTVGSNTPSSTQWGYVTGMNQSVATTSTPTFSNINIGSDIIHNNDSDNKITFGTDTQTFIASGSSIMNINSAGLQIGSDARITEFDTDTSLAGGNTKVPTDLAVKTYADSNLLFINVVFFGSAGFVRELDYTKVAHSDTAADLGGAVIIPFTGTWRLGICHASTISSRSDSGWIKIMRQNNGTLYTELVSESKTLVNTTAYYTYKTYSTTFTATQGDVISFYWTKNDNPGSGDLRIYHVWLERTA